MSTPGLDDGDLLRVLRSKSAPDKADWETARYLIDSGLAQGHYLQSKGQETYGQVIALHGFEVTHKGREHAVTLQERLKRKSAAFRTLVAVRYVATYLFGIVSGTAIAVGSGWVKTLFHLC